MTARSAHRAKHAHAMNLQPKGRRPIDLGLAVLALLAAVVAIPFVGFVIHAAF